MKGLTEQFLKYPFVHLDTLCEGSKEVQPVRSGSSMALVRFDPVDLVPQQLLDQEAILLTGLSRMDRGNHRRTLKL